MAKVVRVKAHNRTIQSNSPNPGPRVISAQAAQRQFRKTIGGNLLSGKKGSGASAFSSDKALLRGLRKKSK